MKKIWIIIAVIGVIAIIKIFFGEINISLNASFDNPTYVVKISDKSVGLDIQTTKKNTIIPFLVNYVPYSLLFTEGGTYFEYSFGQPIVLDISAYNCYTDITGKETLIGCSSSSNKHILKEISNAQYYKMSITGGSPVGMTNTPVYNGEYLANITDLLKNKGKYQVVIYAKYDNYESQIIMLLNLV